MFTTNIGIFRLDIIVGSLIGCFKTERSRAGKLARKDEIYSSGIPFCIREERKIRHSRVGATSDSMGGM